METLHKAERKYHPSPDHIKVVKSKQFPGKWAIVNPHPGRNQMHFTTAETFEGAIYIATHSQ